MSIRQIFVDKVCELYPGLPHRQVDQLTSEYLVSPFQLNLPDEVLQQAKQFVKEVYSLRESAFYKDFYKEEIKRRGLVDPGNKSILMSYDFHLSSENQLKLIEINTNASFLALSDVLYQCQNKQGPKPNPLLELRKSILEELQLNSRSVSVPKVAIIDDQPQAQKLYLEFLVYQELFKSWGWEAQIRDYRELPHDVDFIYNRYTDFYFDQPSASHLKSGFQKNQWCLSPHPYEYFLLADKQRLIDLNQQGWIRSQALPKCCALNRETAEDIWGQRKKWFLKPMHSFGAKQSYRGEKISRKTFEELISQGGFVAQEYIPAPERDFSSHRLKFDLRFYVYKDQVQSWVARLYQGQVTNLQTPGGGFATVDFNQLNHI